MPPQINTNALRQALIAHALQQQGATAVANPAMRIQPSGPLPGGMPNVPGQPAPQAVPPPGAPPQVNAVPPTGGASPAQGMAKAAQQAQSPLLEPQTREIAKNLVQALMKHL